MQAYLQAPYGVEKERIKSALGAYTLRAAQLGGDCVALRKHSIGPASAADRAVSSGVAVIYARYSSHAQRDASIEQQIEECTAFAKRNNLFVLET